MPVERVTKWMRCFRRFAAKLARMWRWAKGCQGGPYIRPMARRGGVLSAPPLHAVNSRPTYPNRHHTLVEQLEARHDHLAGAARNSAIVAKPAVPGESLLWGRHRPSGRSKSTCRAPDSAPSPLFRRRATRLEAIGLRFRRVLVVQKGNPDQARSRPRPTKPVAIPSRSLRQ